MSTSTLNNYADVQNALNEFCKSVNVNPKSAPHGDFWNTLSYEEFTTGDVPNFNNVKILVVGDAKSSNIIQILEGVGQMAGIYGPMPPGVPQDEKTDIISELSTWIDNNCPN